MYIYIYMNIIYIYTHNIYIYIYVLEALSPFSRMPGSGSEARDFCRPAERIIRSVFKISKLFLRPRPWQFEI